MHFLTQFLAQMLYWAVVVVKMTLAHIDGFSSLYLLTHTKNVEFSLLNLVL